MENIYEMAGRHYIAKFRNCEALHDIHHIMHTALYNSGCNVIDYVSHEFINGGLTLVFLLQESHCSIHTYPEVNGAFVDLFTCGDKTDIDTFHFYLTSYFKPEDFEFEIIERK